MNNEQTALHRAISALRYMCDCHAATAERLLALKSTGASERRRQLRLCKKALGLLCDVESVAGKDNGGSDPIKFRLSSILNEYISEL